MTLNAPFAELEALVNRETVAHLSNAVATFASGEQVSGIFDDAHARGDVGMLSMADSRPTFTLLTADIPLAVRNWFVLYVNPGLSHEDPDAVDLRLVLRGLTYRVTEHEPDGTGMSTLVLKQESRA